MLRVYYSNRTEKLLEALMERMREHRGSFYEPVSIVVPNQNVETYLKLALARETGICANVLFRYPRDLIESLRDGRARQLALEDRIFAALFDDELLKKAELGPIQSYLAAGEKSRKGVDIRRVQLGKELSRLYTRYRDARPELLQCWRAGLFVGGEKERELESWQRSLWLEVVAPATASIGDAAVAPSVLHVFGLSYMSRAERDALLRLSKSTTIYVYSLNPCHEIWEVNASPGPDATTLRRYERRGQDLGPGEMFSVHDPFRLSNQGEMLPLRLWARPGRENLRLLNALTGCELVSRIHEPESKTLLHQLQRDIALRKPERTSIPEELDFDDDESIVFFECGNVRRELEAIASEIWRLMEASPSLRFNEVAVILVRSRAERYQALIGSVFSEMHHLPYNVVDLPVRSESRLVEACELLLDIPNGRLTRHELLRFITHPTVLASLPDASSAEWAAWCDALGIVHGADRHDHEGTYIRKDVFNWDQGLKRLALGAFMSGERSGDDRLFEQKGDTYLAEEISSDRMASAGSFGLLIRSLLADAREAGPVQMTVAAWMDFMSGFISSYVEPRTLEDKRVMRKCLREVAALGSMRVGGKKVGYSVARELVRSALSGLSGSRGQYLVDGIVVSSFLPMRSIPFKVIFVAGMGENHFPATDRKNPLDLGDAQERAGNVSAREQDKYLFLETLLSAREKLYLTYVGRDELTGESLSPSSVVLELRETLKRGYVPEPLNRQYPRRRYDDPRTGRFLPAAKREASARALGESLRMHLGRSHLPPLSKLDLPDGVREALGLLAPPASSPGVVDRGTVSLSALRQFLECPLQGSARFVLRLREDDADLLAREDEVFRASASDRARLLRAAFRDGGDRAAYDEAAHRFELKGSRPTGAFGDAERQLHLEILESWRTALGEVIGDTKELVLSARAPHILALGDKRVELYESPLFLVERASLSVHLCSKKRPYFHMQKESLKGFLDHVFHCAVGLDERRAAPYRFVVINAPPNCKPSSEHFTFAPISRDEARRYLEVLVTDLCRGVHDYFLPCEVVFAELAKLSLARTSSQFGPVAHPEDYEALDENAARTIVERRFGLYYRSLGIAR